MEGYFAFQVTSLSANLCLLEDIVEGELETLVKEGKEWLSQLFKEVKPWNRQTMMLKEWHG